MTAASRESCTIAAMLALSARLLGGDSARADVELLLARALGRDRAWLYAHGDETASEAALSAFDALLGQRKRGEPIAQILGSREFWSLALSVTPDTLVPRPETELLVELALGKMRGRPGCRVLDLGTGTGAVAIALASEIPDASITAVDLDARALAVAERNASVLVKGRVRLLQGDWYSPLAGERFDVIVSNPPYLSESDPHLDQGDLRFEPRLALVSGGDGLAALRTIIAGATERLCPGGDLLVEHGSSQGKAVRELFEQAGFTEIRIHTDLEARDRVTSGRRHN